MTRFATLDDVPRLVEMGRRFHASTSYRDLIRENAAQMAATATHLIESDGGCVLVQEREGGALVGMIGMLTFPHHLSGERVAGEVFWWVEPEYRGAGVRLLKAAEAWAREQEAVTVQMIAPSAEVGAMYARLGYTAAETTYQRTLER